jgi:hypothetical protein
MTCPTCKQKCEEIGLHVTGGVMLAGCDRCQTSGVDDALEHMVCEDCGCSIITVLLSDGRALCASCAAIRFRIPTTDPMRLKAEIRTRLEEAQA